jgi:hypothetical protein
MALEDQEGNLGEEDDQNNRKGLYVDKGVRGRKEGVGTWKDAEVDKEEDMRVVGR